MSTLVRTALALVGIALVLSALGVLTPEGSTVPGASAVTRQSGRTSLLPQIVQPGRRVSRADDARLVGSVRFRPARKGRPVLIQRRVGGGAWRKVTVKRQNRAGVVSFAGPARSSKGRWFTYRGVARHWNGLPKVASRTQSARVWRRKFSDEFNGPTLDLTKWEYRHIGIYRSESDRACSASYPDAVEVGGGRVSLQVERDELRPVECVGVDRQGRVHENNRSWYRNGHIGTQHLPDGQFRFGVAAARIKFDRHRGAHGSFWMQSTVPDRDGVGPARDGAEIDVVEYFGKDFWHGDVYQFVHYKDRSGDARKVPDGPTSQNPARLARRALKGDDDWFKRYHVFSVEWTPEAYVFRVDGIRTRTITQGVSKVPEYLILSMLSSGWELEKVDPATLPNATQVDWVRFWQK